MNGGSCVPAAFSRLIYRLKNESAAYYLFTSSPASCPPALLLFLYLRLSLSSCGGLVWTTAALRAGERGDGGRLAFALNRVDILSLSWKVERTLETPGGGATTLSTIERATADRWAGQQEQPPLSHVRSEVSDVEDLN